MDLTSVAGEPGQSPIKPLDAEPFVVKLENMPADGYVIQTIEDHESVDFDYEPVLPRPLHPPVRPVQPPDRGPF